MPKSAETPSPAEPAAAADAARGPTDAAHALLLFREMLQELRVARQREDFVTFGFAVLLVVIAAGPVLEPHTGASIWSRAIAAVGIAVLGWRVNGFLAENRNRQNQVKKIISITEHSYAFPTDRAFVRMSDFKNLDGPGEWDKSDYSLADWDRSEYSVFLKLLLVVSMLAVLFF